MENGTEIIVFWRSTKPQYPVENQDTNIDGTPETNIVKERVCGHVGYHLQILKRLECVSRSMIFYEEVAQVKETKLTLAQKMKEKFAEALPDN